MNDEVLVKVEGVSKKYCRSLKRSMWYGVQDVTSEMLGRKGHHDELRKNEFWAVNDVSFELKRGECLGLIGPNGAGKSTLLKMLNGLIKPDKGRITMRGRIGALIELGAGFNPILTARENIYVNGSVLGFSRKEMDQKFDAIVDFAEIEEFIDTPVQSFSSGMKVRLGFAIAAQVEPDIMLIDEILSVGDAKFRAKCYGRLSNSKNEITTIFVSHSADQIARICSLGLYIEKGVEKYFGDTHQALAAYHNNQKVLGSGFLELLNPVSEFIVEPNKLLIDQGDSLTISAYLKTTETMSNLQARFSIFNDFGFVATDCQVPIDVIYKGQNTIRVVMKNLRLKKGFYSLSINIANEHGAFVVWFHRLTEFVVETNLHNAISPCVLQLSGVTVTNEH